MAVAKRPAIPTDESAMPAWLCENPAHVEEYLFVEGSRWVNVARTWVRQIFGVTNDSIANEIAWGAMATLSQHAGSRRLVEIRSLRPWMNGVIKHMTRDALDQHIRGKSTVEVDPDRLLTVHDEPFDDDESASNIQKIHDCMKGLAEGERRLLSRLMLEPDDPPEPKDMAATMGISPVSVRVQLTTGRSKLKECLAKKGFRL